MKKVISLVLIMASLLVACTVMPSSQSTKQTYTLFVLVPFTGPEGPAFFPADKIQVTELTRPGDGSLCFKSVKDGSRGCVKSDHYYLIEN